MGGLSVNFADVEGGYEPLPEGEYDAIIEAVEVRDSKSSDHDYLNWEFKILDEEFEDRRVWGITSLSPKALFRLKDDFVALGIIEGDEELDIEWEDGVDITSQEGPSVIEPELVGLACVISIENEVYDGKERNRPTIVSGNGEAAGRAPEDDEGDDDAGEDEEEAVEEKPKRASRKTAAAKKKAPAKKPAGRKKQTARKRNLR